MGWVGAGVTDQAGRHGPGGGQVVTFGANCIKPGQPSEECGVCEMQTDANGGDGDGGGAGVSVPQCSGPRSAQLAPARAGSWVAGLRWGGRPKLAGSPTTSSAAPRIPPRRPAPRRPAQRPTQ